MGGTDGAEEKEGLQEKSTPPQDQIVAVIGFPTFYIENHIGWKLKGDRYVTHLKKSYQGH